MAGKPEGFNTITPQIYVSSGDKAIALYKKALGAKEVGVFRTPDGKTIMHACLDIGGSKLFLSDFQPQGPVKGQGSSFYLYVANVDAAHRKAVSAGMKEGMAPTDMFWGDRMSAVTDAFGHNWNFATNKRRVDPPDMQKAMKAQFGDAMGSADKAPKKKKARARK